MRRTMSPDRKFTEGITAMTLGLAFVILGATVLHLPAWSAALLILMGLVSHFIGLRLYKQYYRESEQNR